MDDYQQYMDMLDMKEKAAILDALFEEKEFRQRIGNEAWGWLRQPVESDDVATDVYMSLMSLSEQRILSWEDMDTLLRDVVATIFNEALAPFEKRLGIYVRLKQEENAEKYLAGIIGGLKGYAHMHGAFRRMAGDLPNEKISDLEQFADTWSWRHEDRTAYNAILKSAEELMEEAAKRS
jgi:hypothetical protein